MFVFVKYSNLGQKLTLQFKHVKFKYISKNLSSVQKHYHALELFTQQASEVFGCSSATARLLLTKNKKIETLDPSNFLDNAIFCKNHLKLSEVIEFPLIITLKANVLQHRFFSLYELGCVNITANDILKFSYYMEMTPRHLKKKGVLFSKKEHLECYKNFIWHTEAECNNLDRIENIYNSGSTFSSIKKIMNAEFLSRKLNCSMDKTQQMLDTNRYLSLQSICNMDLLIDVLTEKFGFSLEKILQSPNLLSLHHKNLEKLFTTIQDILGISVQLLANAYPAILRKEPETILRNGSILKDFRITEEQLLACPKILLFSPDVLLERLNCLSRSENFTFLKPYKKFLWLVYNYNNLKQRLNDLEACGLPYSLNLFTISKKEFDKYLRMRENRSDIKDTCFYLARVFNCTESEVLSKLQEYPYTKKSSIQNTNKVINFLFNSGVSTKQLWNGLSIIFYNDEIVKNYFNNLKYFPELQPFSEWTEHYNLIQLLIYSIEIDAGFGGDRLFQSNFRMEEPEIVNAINCAL